MDNLTDKEFIEHYLKNHYKKEHEFVLTSIRNPELQHETGTPPQGAYSYLYVALGVAAVIFLILFVYMLYNTFTEDDDPSFTTQSETEQDEETGNHQKEKRKDHQTEDREPALWPQTVEDENVEDGGGSSETPSEAPTRENLSSSSCFEFSESVTSGISEQEMRQPNK